MKKARMNELINEMNVFGETYLGLSEIRGMAVVKEYNALAKEVAKRYPGKVLCWDGFGTGNCWMA